MPRLIFKQGRVEIWLTGGEYYIYGITSDPRIAHSLGAAHDIAAAGL
jgi:hypothetical protein